jgi:hypothetical protein
MATSEIQAVDVQESVQVEYGCGVFPKMMLVGEHLNVLSQTAQQITRYKIEWR